MNTFAFDFPFFWENESLDFSSWGVLGGLAVTTGGVASFIDWFCAAWIFRESFLVLVDGATELQAEVVFIESMPFVSWITMVFPSEQLLFSYIDKVVMMLINSLISIKRK